MALSSGSGEDGVRIELYVRSLSPRDSRRRIEAIVATLDRLVDAGTLAEYRVLLTGAELPAAPADAITGYGSYLLNRVAVFQEWATATGRSLDALFERRTVDSAYTGEEYDALVAPTAVMAEYEGGDLRFVAPCDEDGEHVTIRERLEDLEADVDLPSTGRLRDADHALPGEPEVPGFTRSR